MHGCAIHVSVGSNFLWCVNCTICTDNDQLNYADRTNCTYSIPSVCEQTNACLIAFLWYSQSEVVYIPSTWGSFWTNCLQTLFVTFLSIIIPWCSKCIQHFKILSVLNLKFLSTSLSTVFYSIPGCYYFSVYDPIKSSTVQKGKRHVRWSILEFMP